ncbi:nonhemolytic phospholipases C family protein [Aspergillus ibericus CBS 121593]|uniref:Phosphoesterase-domain-containing protein n=1 Tax=Aspergillus ibericus CBS 121593 TaxID=1448316 RepID=A0A395HBY5_9EURO|nr:phosphoesterase-domain-containing protein [Aspergillus ibericus CBS 121593]RAL05427.1 phosphoesterase-domain-containing protein [Aspergillus ibericus CBS 121593]
MFLLSTALALLLGSGPVSAGSLRDIKHVVIFMQENRSWNSVTTNHVQYFGTMAGVRGFNDPNVQVNPDGLPVWYQQVDPDMSNDTTTLLPWYLGYQGGNSTDAIQCMAAGNNGYEESQASLNGGLNNHWARNNTPWSWGYFKRDDIPIHYAIAEGWTAGDMYQEAQITSTNPNRVTLVSGSVNVPGGPQTPDQGGVYIDNTVTPGCDSYNINCYPLKWKTIFEIYEEAGVSWQVYQDKDNFDDNPLARFEQFQNASSSSPLAEKGMAYVGLDSFYGAAANGTLPEISFIVGPAELSEHPPYMPKDGAWLQKKVVDAVTSSPEYTSTLLMISYDESGGYGDHVIPFHSPEGTPGEWMEDPYGIFGKLYVGPGLRVPFYMVSPWTRGNRVFTERADHNSQILFLEQWLTARGYKNVQTPEMVHWRREHMSNLVNALDLDHPDTSIPKLPEAEEPEMSSGSYVGTANCEATYTEPRPPVPYGKQNVTDSLFFEEGYKECVGYLTEGRYLVFEKSGYALTNTGNTTRLSGTAAHKDHSDKKQRWVVHYSSGEESQIFKLSSALDGKWLGPRGTLLPADRRNNAAEVKITFRGNGHGYDLQYVNSTTIALDDQGEVRMNATKGSEDGYKVWSVTYH